MARQQANLCGSQADVFHHAVVSLELNPIADAKRLVGHQRQRPEQGFQRILCSQCEGNTTDSSTCQESPDVDTEVLSPDKKKSHDCHDAHQLGRDAYQLCVKSLRIDSWRGDDDLGDSATGGKDNHDCRQQRHQIGAETNDVQRIVVMGRRDRKDRLDQQLSVISLNEPTWIVTLEDLHHGVHGCWLRLH